MPPPTLTPTDPILASDLASLPSPSAIHDNMSELHPLLGDNLTAQPKKPFYRPRPLWLVPFAITAAIARGMTLAPRVEVYTQLSCEAVYGRHPIDYNHTTLISLSNTTHNALTTAAHIDYLSLPFMHSNIFNGNNNTDNNNNGTDPEDFDPMDLPTKRCISDPKVQAGAARLQTIMTTTMGTLSALTTGWWGHFGERHGRTRVLAASSIGLFLTDLTFILVSTPGSVFASHGHKLLIVAPMIEGLLGGWSTLQGATSAYVPFPAQNEYVLLL
ncbi:hypothetical protein BD410DRAFT_837280 [Rickenella mellea]|uniref:Major facilitator superfamily (MFS) profile domain-containing protein n=1 Tax=Rickenella mellea TaxID=50990 RepID=A0A4Y7QDQ4_9AGAM|nr:hypothetical protein BD410DRAFT_837280 [Rickenella mellea]